MISIQNVLYQNMGLLLLYTLYIIVVLLSYIDTIATQSLPIKYGLIYNFNMYMILHMHIQLSNTIPQATVLIMLFVPICMLMIACRIYIWADIPTFIKISFTINRSDRPFGFWNVQFYYSKYYIFVDKYEIHKQLDGPLFTTHICIADQLSRMQFYTVPGCFGIYDYDQDGNSVTARYYQQYSRNKQIPFISYQKKNVLPLHRITWSTQLHSLYLQKNIKKTNFSICLE